MSIFVDTGVFFARLHERDERHDQAQAIAAACLDDAYGSVLTSDYVVDETLTLIQARGGHLGMIRALADEVGWGEPDEPPMATCLEVLAHDRQRAYDLFHRHYERGLSFTDCTTLALLEREGIEALATFDEGFDGLVKVVAE